MNNSNFIKAFFGSLIIAFIVVVILPLMVIYALDLDWDYRIMLVQNSIAGLVAVMLFRILKAKLKD